MYDRDLKRIRKKRGSVYRRQLGKTSEKSRVEGVVKQYLFLESYKEYVGFLYKYSGFTYNDSESSLSFCGLEGALTLDIETGEGKPEEVAFHDFDDFLKRAVEFNCGVETWLD